MHQRDHFGRFGLQQLEQRRPSMIAVVRARANAIAGDDTGASGNYVGFTS